jgi:hypothetical protein
MLKHSCGTGERASRERPAQAVAEHAEPEHIETALARSFENIAAKSDEAREKLSGIKNCPRPCEDGRVNILLSPGWEKKLPCPVLGPGCHYGKRTLMELDRHIIVVMADIGVPLRHLENFREERETEEIIEARKWQALGFLIFTGDAGTGKSFGAATVLREYLTSPAENPFERGSWESVERAGNSAIWCSAMDITGDREIASLAKRASLAVIDDLGGENDTPAGQAAIRGVVLKRYDMKLPTVITTSLTMTEIDIRYGNRMANRLTEDIGKGGMIVGCGNASVRNMPGMKIVMVSERSGGRE